MKYYLNNNKIITFVYIVILFYSIIYINSAFSKIIDNTEECNINQLYCETSNIIQRNCYRYNEFRINKGVYQCKSLFNTFSNFASNNKNIVFNSLIDQKPNKLAFSIKDVYQLFLTAPIQYIPLSIYYKNKIIKITNNNFTNNELFLQSIDKLYTIDITDVDTAEILLAIDNSIKILKNKPDSLEAIFIVNNFIKVGIITNREIKKKFSRWLEDNSGLNVDLARKILYCIILSHEGLSDIIDTSIHTTIKKCNAEVEAIKDNCPDERYRALATFYFYYNGDTYQNEFIKNFPNHSATPYVRLILAESNVLDKEYDIATQEINIILDKQKSLKLPTGWNIDIDCYCLLARISYELNDFDEFNKYYDLIKKNAPEHPFNIKLNNFLRSFQNRHNTLPPPYDIMSR